MMLMVVVDEKKLTPPSLAAAKKVAESVYHVICFDIKTKDTGELICLLLWHLCFAQTLLLSKTIVPILAFSYVVLYCSTFLEAQSRKTHK